MARSCGRVLLARRLQAARVRGLAGSQRSSSQNEDQRCVLCIKLVRASMRRQMVEATSRRRGQIQTPFRLLAECTGNLSPVPSPWKLRSAGGCQWHQAQSAHEGRGVGAEYPGHWARSPRREGRIALLTGLAVAVGPRRVFSLPAESPVTRRCIRSHRGMHLPPLRSRPNVPY